MTEDRYLTTPVANLARAAPHAWGEFLKAFAAYENEQRDNLVKTVEEVTRYQGMALQCAALRAIFENAVQAHDRMEARRAQRHV